MGGMISLGGQPVHVEADHFLWAGADTQLTPLTVQVAYFDPTFCGHSFSLDEKLDKIWHNIYAFFIISLSD